MTSKFIAQVFLCRNCQSP